MRNVNVYVDVDLTLVDAFGRMLPGADDAMRHLHKSGCHLFLWSTGGAQYCREVAGRLGILELFEAFLPKPDIFIDDMPSTIFNGLLFDIQQEATWETLAGRIVKDHVDPRDAR